MDPPIDLPEEPDAGTPPAPNPTAWRSVGSLAQARFFHTATLLPSGRVLIVGGESETGVPLDSVELYDPATETFYELSPLPTPRSNHSSTLLPLGKVLIVAGGRSSGNGRTYPGDDVTDSVLLFDPATNTFSPQPPLTVARSFHEAVLLPEGEVLVVGGGGGTYHAGNPLLADALTSAEVRGADGQWRTVGSLKTSRYFHTVSVLTNGDVLVVGGANETNLSFATAEVFRRATSTFEAAAPMKTSDRFRHAAVTLVDGRVLVGGGKKSSIRFLNSMELYDPTTDQWTIAEPVQMGGNLAQALATAELSIP